MKIYEFKAFSNPRRVRMFLAEKAIDIDYEQIDIPGGDHHKQPFISKNPWAAVPVLELDDGTFISETVAISRYFEELQPEPALMGSTPKEKAVIEMWQRRVESSISNANTNYFHHATDGLGDSGRYRNKQWGEKNAEISFEGFKKLDKQLESNKFVAGVSYSIADITALCAADFALSLKIISLDDFPHVKRWYENVSNRPSAKA